jgi:hypothetical protein
MTPPDELLHQRVNGSESDAGHHELRVRQMRKLSENIAEVGTGKSDPRKKNCRGGKGNCECEYHADRIRTAWPQPGHRPSQWRDQGSQQSPSDEWDKQRQRPLGRMHEGVEDHKQRDQDWSMKHLRLRERCCCDQKRNTRNEGWDLIGRPQLKGGKAYRAERHRHRKSVRAVIDPIARLR